jgi:hypothetical protein
MPALEQFLAGVALPDYADPELRKSEGDLFLWREARNRPPFREEEEVASSLRAPWTLEHGWSS